MEPEEEKDQRRRTARCNLFGSLFLGLLVVVLGFVWATVWPPLLAPASCVLYGWLSCAFLRTVRVEEDLNRLAIYSRTGRRLIMGMVGLIITFAFVAGCLSRADGWVCSQRLDVIAYIGLTCFVTPFVEFSQTAVASMYRQWAQNSQ